MIEAISTTSDFGKRLGLDFSSWFTGLVWTEGRFVFKKKCAFKNIRIRVDETSITLTLNAVFFKKKQKTVIKNCPTGYICLIHNVSVFRSMTGDFWWLIPSISLSFSFSISKILLTFVFMKQILFMALQFCV